MTKLDQLDAKDLKFLNLVRKMTKEQKQWLLVYGKVLNAEMEPPVGFLDELCRAFPGAQDTSVYQQVAQAVQGA